MKTDSLKKRDLLLITAGIAVLLVGKFADSAVNGFASADQAVLDHAIARLDNVPESIGEWVSTSSAPLSEREIEVAGIRGYVRREYRNPKTGYAVNLTLLCGQSGPMSVHPPTACFEGVGYTLLTGPIPTNAEHDNTISQFNKSSFRQGNAAVPEIVRVFWGWGSDGTWSAPANPRFTFRGQSFLYKMYVTDRWLEDTGRTALPQIEGFLADALPVISQVLTQ